MWQWFQEEVVDGGRLPVLVCFAAFVITFVATRVITRMIRSGRGPFKNNVAETGLHVHHAVPGVIILIVGAFTALVVDLDSPWSVVAGLCVGIGTSLVLDEFALILHLSDVYWAEEGRISVEIASLAIACLGLLLVGANPFELEPSEDQTVTLIGTFGAIALHLTFIAICLLKGKYTVALLGAFIPMLASVGAVRLARPRSRWATRRYSEKKMDRAVARLTEHEARWDPITRMVSDFVGGKPSEPDASSTAVESPSSTAGNSRDRSA